MPTVILHLGGRRPRAWTTGAVARILEDHEPEVVVSSEEDPRWVYEELQRHGIPARRIRWHYEAWDTVSQFTLLCPWLVARGVYRLVVVTDYSHLRRALRIAAVVFRGRGIEVIGVPHLGGDLYHRERRGSLWRDELRAIVWWWTGWLWYARDIRRDRLPAILRWAAEAARLPGGMIR